jgi:hypothetical protein
MGCARAAKACTAANRTHPKVTIAAAPSLPSSTVQRWGMLMFKRSQMYIAFALAALAEIIVRAVAH